MVKLGCIKAKKDIRDYKVAKIKNVSFPDSYQIKTLPDVLNQKDVCSCVAHATAELMQVLFGISLSTDYIYGKRNMGYYDTGMYIPDALKTGLLTGYVPRQYFEVDEENKEVRDIIDLVEQKKAKLEPYAEPYKIGSYARCDSTESIKTALMRGLPVVISITVHEDYLSMNDLNVINIGEGDEGGHAIIIYGWNEKGWLVQNSWGKNWGDDGRAILPYNYEIEEAYTVSPKRVKEPDSDIKKPNFYFVREILNFLIKFIERIIKTWKKQDN